MTLTRYPELEPNAVARQGEAWLQCDVASCNAEVEISGVEEATVGGITHSYAPMPDGWVTNDPDDNALKGAAQFCKAHANRVNKPSPDLDAGTITEPPPADPSA